jgi:uncharacterized protein (DUF488 family)
MPTIYTTGYLQKPLKEFIDELRRVGVDVVVDVRLRNTSQLAGYAKKDTLEFLLEAGFDIAYEHHPELAPTDEIFNAYKGAKSGDWAAYEADFLPLLIEREAEVVVGEILARYETPCLLCSEPTAEHCHRRLVAEYWAKHDPELDIVHL